MNEAPKPELPEGPYERFSFNADPGQEPLRLDKFLACRIEKASRVKIKAAIMAGKVLVNGQISRANYLVKPGDEVRVIEFEPIRKLELIPEAMELEVVFEDEDLMVIDKPAGLVVHPGHGNYTGTLVNALAHRLGVPAGDEYVRPWLVHRIDKETSGLIVVSKNEPALVHLQQQFKAHTVRRSYHALVWGSFEQAEGVIEGNIARSAGDRKKFAVVDPEAGGKYALTRFRVLEDFTYTSLVECRLETGRTHQIRVHMKYLGHPLFNDERYGGRKILKGVVFPRYRQFVENCFQLLPRHALHAKSLGFIHPATGKEIYFESPWPDGFARLIGKWRNLNSGYSFS